MEKQYNTSTQTFGPNNKAVVTFLDGCKALTPAEWDTLAAAGDALRVARVAAWDATTWDAARDNAMSGASNAVWNITWAWNVAWAARDVALDAAGAIVVHDLITPAQFDVLTQPFVDAGFASLVGR